MFWRKITVTSSYILVVLSPYFFSIWSLLGASSNWYFILSICSLVWIRALTCRWLSFINLFKYLFLGVYLFLYLFLYLAQMPRGWNLTVESTTFSSILIRWTNLTNVLNRKVGHYIVFVNKRNNSVSLHQILDGDQLTTEINRLFHSTNYTVEVVGIDTMGKPYKTPSEATMTANPMRGNITVFLYAKKSFKS